MKLVRVLACLFTLFFSFSPVAHCQNPEKGSITGTVQDNSGAVVPGATVTATGGAGVTQTATTDEKGEYVIAGLLPGTYTLTVTASGFKDFKVESFTVTPGQATRQDATLEPASLTSSVNVEGQTVTQAETQSSQIAGVLTSKEITTLGLNGRNFTQLIALAPGVSNQTGQDEALVGVKGSVKYSVNGGRVEYNTYDVDGGDILNASINGSSSTLIVYPSVDAIGELQVLTSNYGAMYGRSASGTILAATKAGGADFHGDAYFFVRNNHFNARNFFDQTAHAPLYEKYEPGGVIGGPLFIPNFYNTKKDKTFFFWSEEYRHDKEPITYNQGAPSAGERDCTQAVNPSATQALLCQNPGLASGLSPAQYPFGPNTVFGDFTDVCPAPAFGPVGFARSLKAAKSNNVPFAPDCPGTPNFTSNPDLFGSFPGNLVPIDPRSLAILGSGLIPLPNATSGCNSSIGSCYDASVSPLTTWREDLFRVDHNFNLKEKITFRYIHDAWSTVVTTPQWAVLHNSFPTVENQFVGPGTSMVAHLTSTIANRLANDAAMAYTTDHITITDTPGPGLTSTSLQRPPVLDMPPCTDTPTSTNCGIGSFFNNGFGGHIPGLAFAGTNAAYGGKGFAVDSGYMPWHHSNPTYSPRDDATLAFAKHTLQFGALFIIAQRNEVNPPVGANIGDLQGVATFSNVNNLSSTGNAFADFLTPTIFSYQQDSAQHVYHNNYRVAEPYFQDDWKVTHRLTLNLGLRVSLFGTYHEKNLASFNWLASQFSSALASEVSVAPGSGYLVFGPYNGVLTPSVPLDPNNLDPHFLNGLVRCGVDTYANGKKVPASCMSGHLFNPAPRIGFAWDPFGNGKTSVRGGYGIFWEHGTGNEANTGSLEGSVANANVGGVLDMTQAFPGSWECLGNAAEKFTSTKGTCNFGGPAFPLNLTTIPTKAVWPYAQQWSFSVQRELPGNMLASVAYVGSKGTHLTAELQVNQLVPVNSSQNPFASGQPLTANFCSQAASGIFFVNGPTGPTITPSSPIYNNVLAACTGLSNLGIPVPNALRLTGNAVAPGVGQVFSLQNIANSSYHALQFTLRRAKGPLTLGISYTYSHSIDDSSDRSEAILPNAYNLAQNRASSDFDQRHLLNIDYIYEIPLLKWVDKLTRWADEDPTNQIASHGFSDFQRGLWSGWEISGITLFSTGTPFSVVNGGSTSGVSGIDNAGVASGPSPDSYPDLVLNPDPLAASQRSGGINTFGPLLGNLNAFAAPTALTYGSAGRNFFNNPSRLNFDISLAKNVKLKRESQSLQFRVETFNTFNHTQFRIYDPANPGSSGNNVITCYAGNTFSAGDSSCLAGNSFLRPIDAHRPRTMQLGVKFFF